MHYVEVLRSEAFPEQIYFGVTESLEARLADHNQGRSPHTFKYRPWSLACSVTFPEPTIAFAFERYLKSHSGRAFARKRLLMSPP